MRTLAVVIDDLALGAFPRLEVELAARGVRVLRSFAAVPGPHLLARLPNHRSVAVIGGKSWSGLVQRLEQATATNRSPIIGVLPATQDPECRPGLRWPGVVDLIPPTERQPAERVVLMSDVPIVTLPGRSLGGGCMVGARGKVATAPVGEPMPLRPGPGLLQAGPGSPLLVDVDMGVLAIASSTGGAWVLAQLLRDLRTKCMASLLVAQHLDSEFVPFFGQWLQEVSGWPVCIVADRAPLKPATVHLAAGGLDLVMEGHTMVRSLPASSRFVPSGDRLLASVASARGAHCAGLVLSGMGADGAAGLAAIARGGGRALCQLPESAVVASMPQSALRAAPEARAVAPAFLPAVLLE
ncbi:MAG: chemotaxis protein CheB [Myxococcales bacterium]